MSETKWVRVQLEGMDMTVPEGTSYGELIEKYQKNRFAKQKDDVLLIRENQALRELHHPVKDNAEVRLLTLEDPDGRKTYHRSMMLLMMKAFYDIAGLDDRYAVTVHFVVSHGLYCTIRDPEVLTDDLLFRVEQRMRALVKADLPITKRSVSTSDAIRLFHDRHMYDKEQLFRYRMTSRTNLYELDGYVGYYYGYMVARTSLLKLFSLRRFDDGFVLCSPSSENLKQLPKFVPDQKLFQVQKASLIWGKQLKIMDVGDLNDHIVSGVYEDLIMTQEAYHEKQIAAIAEQIAADPRKKLVMIAGPSSSGKTTFSHRLSTQLSVYGLKPHPIPVDDYFVNREKTPLNPDGTYNFECLEAIDIQLFNKDMTKLLAGEKVELPVFNFKTGKREYKGRYLQLGTNDILVIEGIHCLNDKLSYALPAENKFKIYISALTQLSIDEHNRIPTTDGRLLRRIIRDARTRGTSAAGTIAMWPSVRKGEKNYIFPFQESADVMFNSALIYELSVLKIYAQPLLFGISQDLPEYSEAKRLLKFLDYFVPIPPERIPMNSLIREFIGGSCFSV